MSETKFTKGPWERFPAQNYDGFAIAPRGTLPTLASVERCGAKCNVSVHNFPGSTEANAALIEAAPDMYEALKDCIEALEHVESIGIRVNPPTLANAKAAMAKATP